MNGPAASARPDEHAIWWVMFATGLRPRDVGRLLGVPAKRVLGICEKWSRRRIYAYGVAADLGWPDPQPPDWNRRMTEQQVLVLKYDRPNSGAYDQNFTDGPPDWHKWRTTTVEWEALGRPRTITVTITGGKP